MSLIGSLHDWSVASCKPNQPSSQGDYPRAMIYQKLLLFTTLDVFCSASYFSLFTGRSVHRDVAQELDDAVANKDINSLAMLIQDAGVNPEKVLQLAVENDSFEIVEYLVKNTGVDAGTDKNKAFKTALILGHAKIAEVLHTNSKGVAFYAELMNVEKYLRNAAKKDDADTTQFLISLLPGFMLNTELIDLVELTCKKGLVRVADLLQRSHRKQVDAKCLEIAVNNDRSEFVKTYLHHHQNDITTEMLTKMLSEALGADKLTVDGLTTFKEIVSIFNDDASVKLATTVAIKERHKEAVRYLTSKYLAACVSVISHVTAACIEDSEFEVEFLISCAKRHPKYDKVVLIALSSAVENGALDVLRMMTFKGLLQPHGNLLLQLASSCGNETSARFLLDNNAQATSECIKIALGAGHETVAKFLYHDPSIKDLKKAENDIKMYAVGKVSLDRAPQKKAEDFTSSFEVFKETWMIEQDYTPLSDSFLVGMPEKLTHLEKFVANAFFDRKYLLLPGAAKDMHGYPFIEYKHVTDYFDKFLRLFTEANTEKMAFSPENLASIKKSHDFIDGLRKTAEIHNFPFDQIALNKRIAKLLNKNDKMASWVGRNSDNIYETVHSSVLVVKIENCSLIVRYLKPYFELIYFHSKKNPLSHLKADLTMLKKPRIHVDKAASIFQKLTQMMIDSTHKNAKYTKKEILAAAWPWPSEELDIQDATLTGTGEDLLLFAQIVKNDTEAIRKEFENNKSLKDISGVLKRYIKSTGFAKGEEIALKLTNYRHAAVATFKPLDDTGKVGIWKVFNTGLGSSSAEEGHTHLFEEFSPVSTKWIIQACSYAISNPTSKSFREHYYPEKELDRYDLSYDIVMEQKREIKKSEVQIHDQLSRTCAVSSVHALLKYSLGVPLYTCFKTYILLGVLDAVYTGQNVDGKLRMNIFDETIESYIAPSWSYVQHTHVFENSMKAHMEAMVIASDGNYEMKKFAEISLDLLAEHCKKHNIVLN